MPLNTTLESAQANFYQLLNQLDAGSIDKVNINDNGSLLAVMVTWPIYKAADPSNYETAIADLVAAYSQSPAIYGAPLYRLTKRMRDRGASGGGAQKATGSITVLNGGNISDTETFTLKNAAAVEKVFEFDTGGGVTPGNVAVTFVGTESEAAMAALIKAAIDGVSGFGVASAIAAGATATGSITAVGGASILDTETFTIQNAAGVSKVFEFDLGGGGVTPGNEAVAYVGTETAAQMAALIRAAINGVTGFNVVAAVPVGAVVGLTQSAPGTVGNRTITDTVANAGFLVGGLAGGTNSVISLTQSDPGSKANYTITDTVANPGFTHTGFVGGTDGASATSAIGLKMSKNDADYRAALVPADLAVAIGL